MQQRMNLDEVELSVFTGRLNSLEGPTMGTGDCEAHRDIVAVDNEVSHLPIPVRKCGEQRRELRRNGGWIH